MAGEEVSAVRADGEDTAFRRLLLAVAVILGKGERSGSTAVRRVTLYEGATP